MVLESQALFFDFMERGQLVLVRLDGVINEDNRLQERMAQVSGRKVLIHVAKVERINSCGVRDWVRWLQGLEAQKNSIHLVQCSPAIISQVNMVRNFCGARGHVVSFQAPYFCETCDREHRETFLTSSVTIQAAAPTALCESCGEPMLFDDMEESYFAFLRDHSSRPVDPEVKASMNRFDDAHLATKAAALKEISNGTRIGGAPTPVPSSRPLEGEAPGGGAEAAAASEDKR